MLTTVQTEKTCRVCREPFVPKQSMQVVCGLTCAKRVPILARKDVRAKIAALKPLSHWLRLTQDAFNAWVRERDFHEPCISCGTTKAAWDAGHYRTVGSSPELRFEPMNVHKQCVQCNQSKHGNVLAFRAGLIARHGPEAVDWLEGPHEPKRYRKDDLQALAAHYRALTRDLKASKA